MATIGVMKPEVVRPQIRPVYVVLILTLLVTLCAATFGICIGAVAQLAAADLAPSPLPVQTYAPPPPVCPAGFVITEMTLTHDGYTTGVCAPAGD